MTRNGTCEAAVPAMLAIRVPAGLASVRYRAYAEHVGRTPILVWILWRLRAMAPRGVPIACVCEGEYERERLESTAGRPDDVRFRCARGRNEAHQYRVLMDTEGVRRLIVAGFSHAAAPDRFLTDLLSLHDSQGAHLTDAVGGSFADPCYVIESSLIDHLPMPRVPDASDTVLAAASLLKARRECEPPVGHPFSWCRLNLAERYNLRPARWPERVSIQSARDVEILRRALAAGPARDDGLPDGLIDAWKRAAIAVAGSPWSGPAVTRLRTARARSSRARVLYISGSSGFTGAQQSLVHLIRALDRAQYDPVALVPQEGTFTDKLRRADVIVACAGNEFTSTAVRNLDFARRIIDECAPDIVHANHFIGMPLVSAITAARIPFVQHVRIPNPRRDLCEQIHAADAVIAVSHFTRERIAELDVDLTKVHVIWNGVNVEEFTPNPQARLCSRERLGIPADALVIVVVARITPTKYQDTVIAAVGQVRRAIGRGYLLLVGEIENHTYWHQLTDQIEREGLAAHVTHVEFMADVRPALYASDIMALMSKEESLSRAVLEGMAVGLPSVVGDSGGTKEIVDPDRSGLIVPCRNPERLAQALSSLALDPDRLRAMGTAAVAKVRRQLTAAECAERTMQIYRGLARAPLDMRLSQQHTD